MKEIINNIINSKIVSGIRNSVSQVSNRIMSSEASDDIKRTVGFCSKKIEQTADCVVKKLGLKDTVAEAFLRKLFKVVSIIGSVAFAIFTIKTMINIFPAVLKVTAMTFGSAMIVTMLMKMIKRSFGGEE